MGIANTGRRPQTIQVFLPSGEPRGIRIAEITTRTVQVVHVPRGRLADAANRPEIQGVGVYFLVGEPDDGGKPIVYIGQAEDCLFRIKQHNVKKDFWQHAIAVVSLTNKFTRAHVTYLEWYCIGIAKEVGRYTLDNGNSGGEPYITEPMKAELMDAFEVLDVLTSAIGFPVVERRPSQSAADVFHLTTKGGDVSARGQLVDDGFTVLAGSKSAASLRSSADAFVERLRTTLMEDGVIAQEGDTLRFVESYTFNSPSAAASVLIGGNTNGWTAWKKQDGRTLDQVKRQAPDED